MDGTIEMSGVLLRFCLGPWFTLYNTAGRNVPMVLLSCLGKKQRKPRKKKKNIVLL